ncbi:MAG TPA: hypothetical protein VLK34_04430 [Nocardioidaceae bacterium]|nr:hypothetical protein [Nocardioidaceae bacterium]
MVGDESQGVCVEGSDEVGDAPSVVFGDGIVDGLDVLVVQPR